MYVKSFEMSFCYTEHTYGSIQCLLLACTKMSRASCCLTLFFVERYLCLGVTLFGYFGMFKSTNLGFH